MLSFCVGLQICVRHCGSRWDPKFQRARLFDNAIALFDGRLTLRAPMLVDIMQNALRKAGSHSRAFRWGNIYLSMWISSTSDIYILRLREDDWRGATKAPPFVCSLSRAMTAYSSCRALGAQSDIMLMSGSEDDCCVWPNLWRIYRVWMQQHDGWQGRCVYLCYALGLRIVWLRSSCTWSSWR